MRVVRNQIVAVIVLAFGFSAVGLTQSTSTQLKRNFVVVVHVKPDMVSEWMDLTKYQVIPALKKAGVKKRETWQTVIGNTDEYVLGTPMDKFADLDEQSPLVRALGADGAERLEAEVAKCLVSREAFISTPQPDLSSTPPGQTGHYQIFVLRNVTPGKIGEYENFLKTQVLPIYKKAGARMGVTRRGLGANNDFAIHFFLNDLADLDSESAPDRVLGAAGAATLHAAEDAIAPTTEMVVRRRVPELSYN